MQHVLHYHGVTQQQLRPEVIEAWGVDVVHVASQRQGEHDQHEMNEKKGEQDWFCGFCAETLHGWDVRATHIAAHFRAGLTMESWKDNKGEES